MAQPTIYKGSSVGLFLEDLANAGTFLRPCGLNDHSFSFSKNTNEITVPDCDDPDLPAWIAREVESLDFAGSGSGILALEAVDQWWTAFATTDAINIRAYVGKPDDAAKGRFWAGLMHITAFEVTGTRGDNAAISVSAASSGELTYTQVV